jgi:hypothetical protein
MLSHCLTNKALRHEDVWVSGCINPRILGPGTSLRWVVNFTPLLFYPREGSPSLPPGKELPVNIGYEVEWNSEPVWTIWRN